MPEQKTARWKIITGYVAFGLFSFVLGLYLTFPYDALETTVKTAAEGAGLYVKMQSLRPGLFGITATNVQISKKSVAGEAKPPEPLVINSSEVRPSLFPPRLHPSPNASNGP